MLVVPPPSDRPAPPSDRPPPPPLESATQQPSDRVSGPSTTDPDVPQEPIPAHLMNDLVSGGEVALQVLIRSMRRIASEREAAEQRVADDGEHASKEEEQAVVRRSGDRQRSTKVQPVKHNQPVFVRATLDRPSAIAQLGEADNNSHVAKGIEDRDVEEDASGGIVAALSSFKSRLVGSRGPASSTTTPRSSAAGKKKRRHSMTTLIRRRPKHRPDSQPCNLQSYDSSAVSTSPVTAVTMNSSTNGTSGMTTTTATASAGAEKAPSGNMDDLKCKCAGQQLDLALEQAVKENQALRDQVAQLEWALDVVRDDADRIRAEAWAVLAQMDSTRLSPCPKCASPPPPLRTQQARRLAALGQRLRAEDGGRAEDNDDDDGDNNNNNNNDKGEGGEDLESSSKRLNQELEQSGRLSFIKKLGILSDGVESTRQVAHERNLTSLFQPDVKSHSPTRVQDALHH